MMREYRLCSLCSLAHLSEVAGRWLGGRALISNTAHAYKGMLLQDIDADVNGWNSKREYRFSYFGTR